MKATFDNTVSVLVKAYLNDTLAHNECSACAVGNIIADSKGYKLEYSDFYKAYLWQDGFASPHWGAVFCSGINGQAINLNQYIGKAKDQIDSTGYTWIELAQIEKAFESAPKGKSDDEWMFNGLMSVIDVLADIHNIDLTQKETAKALFVK